MKIKTYEHNPPHIFMQNTKYFITASIYNKVKLLSSEESKYKLLEYIKLSVERNNWKLEDWVILDNHYHLMLESNDSPEILTKIINSIHRYSSIWIKKHFRTPYKQI